MRLSLAAIVLAAVAVRAWGIDFGLPQLCYPDEPVYVQTAQQIFKSGDLNPRFFNFPSLFFYLNALAYVPYYLVGWLAGYFDSFADIRSPQLLTIAVGITEQPSTFLLARGTTAIFASATVAAVFALARRAGGGNAAGLIAAALLAVSPTAVSESRVVAPDTFAAFFAALAILFALRAYDSGQLLGYAAAGALVGLTASAKYNGAIVAVAVVVSVMLKLGSSRRALAALALAGLSAVVAFLLTSPFVLLDYPRFAADFAFESRHYSTGHSGVTGSSTLFYVDILFGREGAIGLLGLVALSFAAVTRDRRLWILCSFPLVYFVFITRFPVHNERTLLPLLPAVVASAAVLLARASARLGEWALPALARIAATAVIAVALILFPLSRAVAETRQLRAEKAYQVAYAWIEKRLPPGASIVVEGYGPYIDPKRFDVKGVGYLTYKPPHYYRRRFDYLVFSSGAYARFFDNAKAFRRQVRGYRALFRSLRHVETFDVGGQTIRIFATDRAPSAGAP